MATATLAEIDAALYTALSALQTDQTTGPTSTRPFALVARYSSDPGGGVSAGARGIVEACTQFPAALLRFDREESARDVNVVVGDHEDVTRCQWSVLIAVEDPRGPDEAVAATTASGVPGMLVLTGAVMSALNGLTVSQGTWHWRRIQHTRTYPRLVNSGVLLVYGMEFSAIRVAESTAPADTSVALTEIRGDVNLVDPPAPAPVTFTNPFETIRATP